MLTFRILEMTSDLGAELSKSGVDSSRDAVHQMPTRPQMVNKDRFLHHKQDLREDQLRSGV